MPISPGTAAADTTWTQTSQADFASGTPVQLDISSSPGDVKLAKSDGNCIYTFKGNGTKTFWRYNIASDNWSTLANAPQNISSGGAMAYDGGSYIYALAGGGTKYFFRYNIAANTWTSLSNTTSSVNAGGSLVYDGGNYLYALRGGGYSTFWRYSISGGTWSTRASTPMSVNGGGALTYNGGNYIYALGGMSTYFWKYSISGNTWTWLTGTPSNVGDGGSLAHDGGDYVYALKGSNTVTFWRYSITGNSWTAMADTPATPCVYGGGALAYDKEAYFYALRGNNEDDFWQYNAAGNSWSSKTNTPSNVAYGGALAFKAPNYYSSGNLTSSTYDTGHPSNFGNISWTAATPAGTSVKFQVATNNDTATWVFRGPDGATSTYYTTSGTTIWSGHNSDRYIKYKALLDTTNTAMTPVLNDISITYSPHIMLPTAATSDAALVEETTATLNGTVTSDGGEPCQYQFIYSTASGGPYPYSTGWTGSLTMGQTFSVDVTGLAKGTKHYFRAQVKSSAGTGSGDELDFLTKPDPPVDTTFIAAPTSYTEINLTWTKGEGAQKTLIVRKTGDYPADRTDGVQVYFDTGTSFTDTGLTPETMYYYCGWSQVSGSEQWSDGFRATVATTSPPTTTTTPPVTTPVAVGGRVFPVNKAQVLAPWLGALAALAISGWATFRFVRAIKKHLI